MVLLVKNQLKVAYIINKLDPKIPIGFRECSFEEWSNPDSKELLIGWTPDI